MNNRGFIAITSAVIISALLLIVVFVASASSFASRFNTLDAHEKAAGLFLAEACAEHALLKLAQSPSYAGNETVPVAGGAVCVIAAVSGAGAEKIVRVSATSGRANTYVKITAGTGPLQLISWEETAAP